MDGQKLSLEQAKLVTRVLVKSKVTGIFQNTALKAAEEHVSECYSRGLFLCVDPTSEMGKILRSNGVI